MRENDGAVKHLSDTLWHTPLVGNSVHFNGGRRTRLTLVTELGYILLFLLQHSNIRVKRHQAILWDGLVRIRHGVRFGTVILRRCKQDLSPNMKDK